MSWCKSFGSRTSKHKYPPVCLPACMPGLYSDYTISHIWGWRVESGGMGWNWGWHIWGTPWFPTLHIFIIMKFTIFMEKWILLFKWLRHCLRVWCPDVRTWHGADGRYSPVETWRGPGGVTLLSPNMLLIQVRRALLQSTDFSLTERVRAAL